MPVYIYFTTVNAAEDYTDCVSVQAAVERLQAMHAESAQAEARLRTGCGTPDDEDLVLPAGVFRVGVVDVGDENGENSRLVALVFGGQAYALTPLTMRTGGVNVDTRFLQDAG